jgi:hypothetical protein
MFSYAFAKILKTQFNFGPVWEADVNVSNYDGFMLTWYYFAGQSPLKNRGCS